MKISKTNFVEAHYRLSEESKDGQLIEQTFDKEPLGFVFGVGMMIPGFETQIEGLEVGAKKAFVVVAEEAYGLYNDDNVAELPRENFGDEEHQKEFLIAGKQIALQDDAGREHIGLIEEVKENTVTIDFNHPMAGNDLFFDVEIINIRETSEEELSEMGLTFEG